MWTLCCIIRAVDKTQSVVQSGLAAAPSVESFRVINSQTDKRQTGRRLSHGGWSAAASDLRVVLPAPAPSNRLDYVIRPFQSARRNWLPRTMLELTESAK